MRPEEALTAVLAVAAMTAAAAVSAMTVVPAVAAETAVAATYSRDSTDCSGSSNDLDSSGISKHMHIMPDWHFDNGCKQTRARLHASQDGDELVEERVGCVEQSQCQESACSILC